MHNRSLQPTSKPIGSGIEFGLNSHLEITEIDTVAIKVVDLAKSNCGDAHEGSDKGNLA